MRARQAWGEAPRQLAFMHTAPSAALAHGGARISAMPTTPTNEAQRGRTCAGLRRRRSLRSRHAWDQSERERSGQAKRQQSSLAGRIACGRGLLAGAARRRRAGSGRSERPRGGRLPPLPAGNDPTRGRGPPGGRGGSPFSSLAQLESLDPRAAREPPLGGVLWARARTPLGRAPGGFLDVSAPQGGSPGGFPGGAKDGPY